MLESLQAHGVDFIFANIGTDYPPVVEAIARFGRDGIPMPRVVICQHEMVTLSAAHGYALASGRTQAVFVHVDVGTQNMGGAVHNASRARVPAVIIAGLSPYTTRGELPGSRSSPIQYVQDIADQAGIVRPYVKFSTELRTAINIPLLIARAFQVAAAEPAGLAYLTATRETLEQVVQRTNMWTVVPPPEPAVPADAALRKFIQMLRTAEFPLAVTSYAGRTAGAQEALVELAELTGLGVVESEIQCGSFPTDSPLHAGTAPTNIISSADLLFLLDVDVPWIPALSDLRKDVRLAQLDVDPVKAGIPLWDFQTHLSMRGTTRESLQRLVELVRTEPFPVTLVRERTNRLAQLHAERTKECERLERQEAGRGELTGWTVARALDEVLGNRAVVIHEAVSNGRDTIKYLRRGGKRLHFASGGSALGWGGGAAIGVKLALPDEDVVFLTGDGNFIFSAPTAVYWGARRYNTPFLTVILNNGGWNAVKGATLQQHPEGYASQTGDFTANFEPASDLTLVAQASGAHTIVVREYSSLHDAIREGLAATRRGTCAVVDVKLHQVV